MYDLPDLPKVTSTVTERTSTGDIMQPVLGKSRSSTGRMSDQYW